MVGTGRFELPTPRTPSECSTRLSHVPTQLSRLGRAGFLGSELVYTSTRRTLRCPTGLVCRSSVEKNWQQPIHSKVNQAAPDGLADSIRLLGLPKQATNHDGRRTNH